MSVDWKISTSGNRAVKILYHVASAYTSNKDRSTSPDTTGRDWMRRDTTSPRCRATVCRSGRLYTTRNKISDDVRSTSCVVTSDHSALCEIGLTSGGCTGRRGWIRTRSPYLRQLCDSCKSSEFCRGKERVALGPTAHIQQKSSFWKTLSPVPHCYGKCGKVPPFVVVYQLHPGLFYRLLVAHSTQRRWCVIPPRYLQLTQWIFPPSQSVALHYLRTPIV